MKYIYFFVEAFGPLYVVCYSPEDVTHEVLLRKMVSINGWNLIKIVRAVFERIEILYLGSCEGPLIFGIRIAIFTGLWYMMNEFLNTEIRIKLMQQFKSFLENLRIPSAHCRLCRYFTEGTSCSVSLRAVGSMNYWNWIKIIRAVLRKL
jgi:hypothetical protein